MRFFSRISFVSHNNLLVIFANLIVQYFKNIPVFILFPFLFCFHIVNIVCSIVLSSSLRVLSNETCRVTTIITQICQMLFSSIVQGKHGAGNYTGSAICCEGFHYYRVTWTPSQDEVLICEKEEDNPYDVFAIKVFDGRGIIVGHLPMEISRYCFFLILRGATLNCIITDKKY